MMAENAVGQVLQQAEEELMNTELCRNATNFVGIRGSSTPSIVFIGEAPGKNEDLEGRPFTGRAGKLLDQWIAGLGLSEDEYAITNLVKCRPPNNRTPTREEARIFGAWLEKELDAMDADVIIPLGKSATEYLLPEAKKQGFLKDTCYQRFDSEIGTVLPFPHPSYALRNGGFDLEYEKLSQKIDRCRQ